MACRLTRNRREFPVSLSLIAVLLSERNVQCWIESILTESLAGGSIKSMGLQRGRKERSRMDICCWWPLNKNEEWLYLR